MVFKKRRWQVLGLVFLLVLGVFPQVTSADIVEEVLKRIAFVDVVKVFQQYEKKKALQLRLQEETKAQRERLEEMGKEVDKLKEEYQLQLPLLTEEAKKQRQQEITEKIQQIESLTQQLSEQIKSKWEEYSQQILDDIMKKVEEIASREGYIYVFDKAALVFAASETDITDKVIEELNREFKEEKGE